MAAQLPLGFEAPKQRRAAGLASFHVRDESPAEALAGEARAKTQDAVVLDWMRTRQAGFRTTPSQLQTDLAQFRGELWPITSVRRALTNLSTERPGQELPPLRKHPEDRRPGPRGARECVWSLA